MTTPELRNLPQHVAIIMDGNGRWANARNLPRIEGHKAGAKSVRKVVEESRRLGVNGDRAIRGEEGRDLLLSAQRDPNTQLTHPLADGIGREAKRPGD